MADVRARAGHKNHKPTCSCIGTLKRALCIFKKKQNAADRSTHYVTDTNASSTQNTDHSSVTMRAMFKQENGPQAVLPPIREQKETIDDEEKYVFRFI